MSLFNKSLVESKIPIEWKSALISRIPKKNNDLDNPKSYRPISLNSCLGKLLEKLVLNRIKKHLHKNKIILNQQSGFRTHRQTKDNLLFIIQKIQESFARRKKVLSFFFDISQAFDKVWHEGLIYKLIEIKLQLYLTKWIIFYLKERNFIVKVDDFISEKKIIKCGAPQGAVLSPTLFSIYINDVPVMFNRNKSYTLLFADDISTFFIFKKSGSVKKTIKDYMLKMELWLSKWRLTMHPK
jgi:hypothetical protein